MACGDSCISVSTSTLTGFSPCISTIMFSAVISRERTLDKICSRAAFSASKHRFSCWSGVSSGSPISSKNFSPRAEVTYPTALAARLVLNLVESWSVGL